MQDGVEIGKGGGGRAKLGVSQKAWHGTAIESLKTSSIVIELICIDVRVGSLLLMSSFGHCSSYGISYVS